MTDLQDLYRRSQDEFRRRVEVIRDDQWDNDTPCTEWTVRDLVNHIVYEDRWTAPLINGATVEEVGDRFDGDLLGSDPKGAWADASREARAAVDQDGVFDREVNVSWGVISAEEYVWQLTNDHAIHAWDLARGIGDDDDIDDELVNELWARALGRREVIRASAVFGDEQEVPEDADTQTKLLGLLGRKR